MRKRNSKKRLEVASSGSRKTPPKKGLKKRSMMSLLAIASQHVRAQRGHAQLVGQRHDRVEEKASRSGEVAKGVGEAMEASTVPHQRTGAKVFQLQCRVIELPPRFGIGR
jgi:hypothetical protein